MGLPEMGELDPMKRGAGDISFVARDVDGLVGLGPAGDGDHAPGRDGRYRLDLAPGEARRDFDEPPKPRKTLNLSRAANQGARNLPRCSPFCPLPTDREELVMRKRELIDAGRIEPKREGHRGAR